jgi:hypothetical protein
VECFNYLGIVIVKLNPGLPLQKQQSTRKKLFYQQTGLQEETSGVLLSEHSLLCMMLKL